MQGMVGRTRAIVCSSSANNAAHYTLVWRMLSVNVLWYVRISTCVYAVVVVRVCGQTVATLQYFPLCGIHKLKQIHRNVRLNIQVPGDTSKKRHLDQ